MMSNVGVGWRREVFIIGDNSCGAVLLCAHMNIPTRFFRVMGYADNMPKKDNYFGFSTGLTRWKPSHVGEDT